MKRWIILCIFVLLASMTGAVFVYLNATEPLKKAEEKAIEVAMKNTDLSTFTNFELYNGEETYYVLTAENSNREVVYVWISENDHEYFVEKAKNGVNKEEALKIVHRDRDPKEIIAVRLGMTRIKETVRPAWEIYFRSENGNLNYYYVDFETGEKLRAIDNF